MIKLSISEGNEKELNTTNRFVSDILRYAPSKIIPSIITLIWSYVFTRVFPASEYGLYGLVLAITTASVTIITEWAAQPIGRFYAEYVEDERLKVVFFKTLKKFFKIILTISLILGVVSLTIVYFYWGEYTQIAICAILVVTVNSITTLLKPVLPASLDALSFRKLEILRNIFRLIVALSLVLGISHNISFLLLADFIGSLIFVIPLMYIVIQKLNIPSNNKFEALNNNEFALPLKRFITYGMPMMIWFFCSQLLNVGDRFVIQYFFGAKDVGIYTANYTLISGIASLLGVPISLAAFPLIMKLWAKGKEKEIPSVIYKMTKVYAILAVALVAGTFVVGEDFVKMLLDTEYLTGYKILTPVVLGTVFVQASMLGQKGIELNESTLIMVYCMAFAAFINLGLNIIVVPIFGYISAAWTTVISYFIYVFLIWYKSKKFIYWKIPISFIIVLILIAFFAIQGALLFTVRSSVINFILQGLVFTICYFILLFFYLKIMKDKLLTN
jgi:O-antigen/teichoic acid export membrane protein